METNYVGLFFLVLIIASCGFLIVNYIIYQFIDVIDNFRSRIFSPKIEVIRAKIIRLKVEKFYIPVSSPLSENNNFVQIVASSDYQAFATIGYFAFLLDRSNGRKHYVEISSDAFRELEQKKSLFFKNDVFLHFKKYFWGHNFDHYEIASEKELQASPETNLELVIV